MRLTWIQIVLDVLAVHRLTRLATKDVISQPLRDRIIAWAYSRAGHDPAILEGDLQVMVEADMAEDPNGTPRIAVLVVCRWCASIWIAAGVVAAERIVPGWWQWAALGLAVSSASTFLARVEQG